MPSSLMRPDPTLCNSLSNAVRGIAAPCRMSSRSRAGVLGMPAAAPSGASPSAVPSGAAAPPAAASSTSNAALSQLLSRRHGHGSRKTSSGGVAASAAAPASSDAPSTSRQAEAGEQFGFVCPICQQTRFSLASMPNR